MYLYNSINEIYTIIKNRIISLELKPDEMFSESSMVQQLNANRTEVRAAITQLEEEGYIDVYPQRGTFVSRIDLVKIKQTVQAHTILEQEIIKEIIRRGITKDELDVLRRTLEEQSKDKKGNDLVKLVRGEHSLSYQLSVFCKKEFIWDVFQKMDSNFLRLQYLHYLTFNHQGYTLYPSSIDVALIENRLLVDSLARGDEGVAVLNRMNYYAKVMWQAEIIRGFYPQYFIA